MLDPVREENPGAGAHVELSASELKSKSTRKNVPRLVLGAVTVKWDSPLRVRALFHLLHGEASGFRSQDLTQERALDVLRLGHSHANHSNLD